MQQRTKNTRLKDREIRPSLTPEGREKQIGSLAMDLAERQIIEGTASSQVITHFLKIISTREELEKKLLEKEMELKEAKTESIQSAKKIEELYAKAIEAMRSYSGNTEENQNEY